MTSGDQVSTATITITTASVVSSFAAASVLQCVVTSTGFVLAWVGASLVGGSGTRVAFSLGSGLGASYGRSGLFHCQQTY